MHLVGFIIRIYHDARYSECQIYKNIFVMSTFYNNWKSGNMNSEFFNLESSSTYSEMSYGGPTVLWMSGVQSLAKTFEII